MVVLHPRAADDSEVVLGKRILGAMSQPIFVSGKEVVLSASIGVALCRPGMKSAAQLLREADTALYAAKDRGRTCCRSGVIGRGGSCPPGVGHPAARMRAHSHAADQSQNLSIG